MATEYRLTAEAEDDLQGIADYTFETFGPAQAEAYGLVCETVSPLSVITPFWAGTTGFFAPGCAAMNMKAIPSITN